jgi:chemotaxis protein methyltransferase CheR
MNAASPAPPLPVAPDLERFRAAVARRLGLQFDDERLAFLGEALRARLEATRLPGDTYLARLESDPSGDESFALARALTVGETYFFRNIEQFRAVAELALPARIAVRQPRRLLRVLSAGCSSGEEAYSLAILLLDRGLGAGWDVSVRAVDANSAALERAERGRYSAWALRETPPDVQRRWFRPDGKDFVLGEGPRALVRFERRNLADEEPDLWPVEGYDLVFCRNVLMYFGSEAAQRVVARIARSLAPGGWLFLGDAETLRGVSQDFHLRHTHGTFYYQRKSPGERAGRLESAAGPSPRPAGPNGAQAAPSLAAVVDGADGWIDAIRRASERIEVLSRAGAEPAAAERAAAGAAPRPAGPPVRWDLGPTLELLRRERFTDALDAVSALPEESATDPEVLLLRAVLLTHGGRLPQAEEACRRVLALDELHAGAQYLMALCREGAGDRDGAAEHDQVASYLDPTFAMPRLHLGLLRRRAGDPDAARAELSQALALLQREDASRLLLFGGGFGRDALVALCRAELQLCGGRP